MSSSGFLDWIHIKSLKAGALSINKFGNAPDFDPGDGKATIWDGAADASVVENMVYDYSTTADIDSISSSNAGDAVEISIEGLDENWNRVVQEITLQGQTRVPLDTNLIRVYRMKNIGNADLVGHVACYVNTALTSGIPTDKSKIRAVITPGTNQTLMAVYSVPAGYTAYLENFWMSTAGAVASSIHEVDLVIREYGGVFQLKNRSSISTGGTSHQLHDLIHALKIGEKSDIEIRANTNQNGASVAAGFELTLIPYVS